MLPQSRTDLQEYALRELGFPVIDINVDEDQLQDRIDQALLRFQTYHYDGKLLWYNSHLITANDVTNKYVQCTANTIGVTRIFTLSGSSTNSAGNGGFNMFDINYQIRLNELYDYTAGDYVYFELANEHLRMLEMMFTGETPIRYNRYTNLLYIDFDWKTRVQPGDYIIIEQYIQLPAGSTQWGDPWLLEYTTALIKRQWGTNLKKFQSVTLPGGMILNGQQIYNEANDDCLRLEKQLRDEFEDPPLWIFG